jgi:hypothetical protein
MRRVACTEKQNELFVFVLKFYMGYAKITWESKVARNNNGYIISGT